MGAATQAPPTLPPLLDTKNPLSLLINSYQLPKNHQTTFSTERFIEFYITVFFLLKNIACTEKNLLLVFIFAENIYLPVQKINLLLNVLQHMLYLTNK